MVAFSTPGGQLISAGVAGAGDTVTIGDSSLPGVNLRTTWGERIADPGIPLSSLVSIGPVNPQLMWKTQPSLRKVVGFIARNVAAVAWKAYQQVADDDRRRISGSPAETALRQPRRFLTGFQLIQRLVIDKCLYDKWGLALVDGTLQRIPPRILVLVSDQLDNIAAVGASTSRGVVDLSPLPLAVGAGWSSYGAEGVSPLVTLSQILQEQTNAVAWRNAQWDRAPKFSGIITRPKDAPKWESGDRTRFVGDWQEYRDANAGGTPIFEDGMDYKDLRENTKPSDAQDIAGRMLTDAEVASSYFIAPELVGARPGNFSNIKAWKEMLYGPALGPILTEFGQALNAEIVPALDGDAGVYGEFDRQSAMNGAFLEQAQLLSTATGRPWMTTSEARAIQNLRHLDEGDELVTPLNVLIGGQASPQDGITAGRSAKAAPAAIAVGPDLLFALAANVEPPDPQVAAPQLPEPPSPGGPAEPIEPVDPVESEEEEQ